MRCFRGCRGHGPSSCLPARTWLSRQSAVCGSLARFGTWPIVSGSPLFSRQALTRQTAPQDAATAGPALMAGCTRCAPCASESVYPCSAMCTNLHKRLWQLRWWMYCRSRLSSADRPTCSRRRPARVESCTSRRGSGAARQRWRRPRTRCAPRATRASSYASAAPLSGTTTSSSTRAALSGFARRAASSLPM